jgi:Uri superfamily endonuclease
VLKAQPGTYALIFSAASTALISVGKLGSLRLKGGFYVYIGSALGPGGLHARVGRDLNLASRAHWHVDYLRPHTRLAEVWFCCDRIPWECRWASCLASQAGVSVPLAGFGSSDCTCDSHLLFFGSRPSRTAFARRLAKFYPERPRVRLYKPEEA